jgi:hypothetical protein
LVARLILDDALQSYSKDELRFLWRLASGLPPHAVLRACHERQPPSPLNIAIDLRIT